MRIKVDKKENLPATVKICIENDVVVLEEQMHIDGNFILIKDKNKDKAVVLGLKIYKEPIDVIFKRKLLSLLDDDDIKTKIKAIK